MRALRATGNVFIFLGATLLFFVFYEVVGTSFINRGRQGALAQEFEAELLPTSPGIEDPVIEVPDPEPRRGGPQPIARIRIPKIGVNQIVVDGVTLDDLAWGPGWYRGTAPIGEPGSTGIAGHRTGWGSPFIDLDRLAEGDRIFLDTPEATYTYRVTRSRVVDPDQVQVLEGDPRSDATHKLTLTTCTPKYTALRRLIIWADMTDVVPND